MRAGSAKELISALETSASRARWFREVDLDCVLTMVLNTGVCLCMVYMYTHHYVYNVYIHIHNIHWILSTDVQGRRQRVDAGSQHGLNGQGP
jgi:hypothetical protein